MSAERTARQIDAGMRVGSRMTAEALYRAASAAGHAPSVHNTQPWRWRLAAETMDLRSDRGRMHDVVDGRLAILSCGAALNHARVALAAHGWRATVSRLPDPADPDLLARVRIGRRAPIGPGIQRRARNLRQRHTDRLPVTGDPVGPPELSRIAEAVESQQTRLHLLQYEQIIGLAAVSRHDPGAESAADPWHQELAQWTGGPDRPAVFAVLYGHGDHPIDWLRAGEALSALWLVAIELGISVLPLSAPTELAGDRASVRRLLPDAGHPYLALRLGHRAAGDTGTAVDARLPVDQIIE